MWEGTVSLEMSSEINSEQEQDGRCIPSQYKIFNIENLALYHFFWISSGYVLLSLTPVFI